MRLYGVFVVVVLAVLLLFVVLLLLLVLAVMLGAPVLGWELQDHPSPPSQLLSVFEQGQQFAFVLGQVSASYSVVGKEAEEKKRGREKKRISYSLVRVFPLGTYV